MQSHTWRWKLAATATRCPQRGLMVVLRTVLLGLWIGAEPGWHAFADTLLGTQAYTTAGSHTYTVPTGANRILVKVWGAGGRSSEVNGGAGGYVTGAYTVTAGQTINVRVGQGANWNSAGGGASAAWRTGGFQLIAGGGGNGGDSYTEEQDEETVTIAIGGAGGPAGPSGTAGSIGANGSKAGGGGTPSAGGSGASGQLAGGSGSGPMNLAGGGSYSWNGGSGGRGGEGGGGYYGGGGGGGDYSDSGAGGGGGGSNYLDTGNGYVTGSGSNLGGSGRTPPAVADSNYPSSQPGWGGGEGKHGAVVILAYEAEAPAITSPLGVTVMFGEPISYQTTATSYPHAFGATNLPAGLSINTTTGLVTGSVATAGVYTANISATNTVGTGSAPVVFTISNTPVPPSAPSNLAVSSLAANSGTLYWTASTGSASISTYEIKRNGGVVATTSNAQWVMSDLVPSTAYAFSVRALDSRGLWSQWSDEVSGNFNVTTPALGSGTLLATTTFSHIGAAIQTYVVPSSADYIVVKAWGGGGSGISRTYNFTNNQNYGGRGAFVSATYEVSPNEAINILVAGGGNNSVGGWPGGGDGGNGLGGGGGHSQITTSRGTIWAAGGGGAGYFSAYWPYEGQHGGNGGAQSGSAGGSSSLGVGGGGGTLSGAGLGGTLPVTSPGAPGNAGGFGRGGSGGSAGWGAVGGAGGGGSGYFGGGSGGLRSGVWLDSMGTPWYSAVAGGGGGGGASNASGPATNVSYSTTGTSDPHYPNSTIGQGGAPGSAGGNGAVVLLAYRYASPQAPAIEAVAPTVARTNQAIELWIPARHRPTSYAATGLPDGLTINTDTGLISGSPTTAGAYTASVTATNATGTSSAVSVEFLVDDTAPGVPSSVVTSGVTSTALNLQWNASTDNLTGINTYEVRLNGELLGTSTVPAMVVAGLQPGTAYGLEVRARDGAGNWSGWATAVNATTLSDTVAPSVPTGLRVENLLATGLTLRWSASADDVGVAEYEVRRGGSVSCGTSAFAALVITGLSASTSYQFEVRAKDASGNWSNWSSVYSVTTAAAGSDTLVGNQVIFANGLLVQEYVVPAETNYIVVKSWGAGGGGVKNGSTTSLGGNAGYTTATFNVTPGERFSVSVGTAGMGWTFGANVGAQGSSFGGWPGGSAGVGNKGDHSTAGGGGYSRFASGSRVVWAEGGGGSAGGSIYSAGAGGSLGGSYATEGAYNVIHQSGSSGAAGLGDLSYPGNRVGFGGFYNSSIDRNGGNGAVVVLAYKTPGTDLTQTFHPIGTSQTFTLPAGADSVVVKAWGAGGSSSTGAGGGYVQATYAVSGGQTIAVGVGTRGTGGTAGTTTTVTLPGGTILKAAGGLSGDTTEIVVGSQSPTSTQVLTASGVTPPATGDSSYPGNNVGYGAASNGDAGNGAVVIIAHIVAPAITSSLSPSLVQFQPVSYSLTATNGPTSYSASNLPSGLTLDPTTGVVTGMITQPGTYTSTLRATNRGGTTEETVTWSVSADSSAPSTPTSLQSANITHNSFVLSWTASTDNAAVTAYEVKRGETVSEETTGTTATLSGLLPLTTYSMSVRARDGAGNWSAWSTPLEVQTLIPPGNSTLPSGVQVAVFGYSTQSQSYTVPANVGFLVIKAWGAGGGSGGTGSSGGAGAYVSATYNVTQGQTLSIVPGKGGANASTTYTGHGGHATVVSLSGGFTLYAAGGGGGSTKSGAHGGAGGAPSGQAGANGNGASGGQGGTKTGSGSGTTGVGGAGGTGDGMTAVYDEEDNYQYDEPTGNGGTGGTNSATSGGSPGSKGDYGLYEGGGGGGGIGGGGGGGGGSNPGGGGGGGGSSGIVSGSASLTASSMTAGSGSTAPNTTGVGYPGNNVAYGGVNGSGGGHGAVVILAYPPVPAITSSLAQSVVQNAAISYMITATGTPYAFATSGLPSGLMLNPATGVITGRVAAVGTYNTGLTASNLNGTGPESTLVWTITADTVAPSVPTSLQADNIGTNSFRLSWTPSTDNALVTDYEVKRDGISLGYTPEPQITILGLAPSTAYAMTVQARDIAGNVSGFSSSLSITTASSGAVYYANYAERTASTVALVWGAMPGAAGGYRVYRNGTSIGITTELVFYDFGLTASTSYTYVIRPLDVSGNPLGIGVSVAITTEAGSIDSDGDGIPDAVETRASTNPNAAGTQDGSGNQLNVKIHRPIR